MEKLQGESNHFGVSLRSPAIFFFSGIKWLLTKESGNQGQSTLLQCWTGGFNKPIWRLQATWEVAEKYKSGNDTNLTVIQWDWT